MMHSMEGPGCLEAATLQLLHDRWQRSVLTRSFASVRGVIEPEAVPVEIVRWSAPRVLSLIKWAYRICKGRCVARPMV